MTTSLFELRKEAHEVFDPLWKTGRRSRNGAYMIMADILKLPMEKAHISMLSEDQCKLLIRRIETGNYWVGAGMRLKANRPTIWQRKKKQDVYANIHRLTRQQKAKAQNALRGRKLFRKHNPRTDIPRHWKRPQEPLPVPPEPNPWYKVGWGTFLKLLSRKDAAEE